MRISDWSSDVCSSDLGAVPVEADDKDYATDVDALLAAVTDKTRVVYLANPNNPTGTLATREEVARLYAGLPKNVLFVIDQAYSEYRSEERRVGIECVSTVRYRGGRHQNKKQKKIKT